MEELKDVLFLMPKIPYPPYADGTVLIYYYLTKYLGKMNIICFSLDDTPTNHVESNITPSYVQKHRIITLELKKSKMLNKVSFFNGYDRNMNYYYDKDHLKFIINYIRENKIKKVFCNITLIKYANQILDLTDCTVFLHSIDAKSMVEKTRIGSNSILDKTKGQILYTVYSSIEKKLEKFQKTIVVSNKDKEYLIKNAQLSMNKVFTINNGVDTDYFKKLFRNTNTKETNKVKIGFSGILDYYHNEQAVLNFLNNVFPELLNLYPNLEFWIIGKNPTNRIKNSSKPFNGKVIITGFVEDIRECLTDIDIYVSPLMSGGGIKNKILEAMSMSLPIVASETSMDGIDFTDEVLTYSNNKDLINKMIDLIKDPVRRNSLSKKARNLVENSYSWHKKCEEYEKLFLE